MKITKLTQVLLFLKQNPTANYDQIKNEFNINYSYAKSIVSKLKTSGRLMWNGREYVVTDEQIDEIMKEYPILKEDPHFSMKIWKRDIAKHLIEKLVEDFDSATSSEERTQIAYVVVKLMDRVKA